MFAFIFCDVSLTLWAIASLFIYFFFILILMEFQELAEVNMYFQQVVFNQIGKYKS